MNRKERRAKAKPRTSSSKQAASGGPELLARALEHHRAGRLTKAARLYKKILKTFPDQPDALHFLGVIADQSGNHEKAVDLISRAIAVNPDDAEAYNNLGAALKHLGRIEDGAAAYAKAVALWPDYAEAHSNLGNTLRELGRPEEAVASIHRALALKPDNANAHNNLGNAYKALYRLDDAAAAFHRAIELRPNYPEAYNNVGMVLMDEGLIEAAVEAFKMAIAQGVDNPAAHANLLFCMNYEFAFTAGDILAESRHWSEKYGRHDRTGPGPFPNDPSPDRRLKIGYVSPDFKQHSVAYFFEPLLAAHDREHVEIFCYAEVARPDAVTERLKVLADHWYSTVGDDDAAVAEQIRQHGIDILIDLAGYTSGTRLRVFGLKPAPIQVSWLGYPNTTGLSAIDYRLTDAVADPPGESDAHYSEELVRLPNGFHCYQPLAGAPEVDALPAQEMGHLTFGSFNTFPKVSENVITTWAKVLSEVPNSRLLLKAWQFADEAVRERCLDIFRANGIADERLELVPRIAAPEEHLGLYGRVDMALDTFPYGGTTTTCEALWMGVPVVTLKADRHAGRVGASLLTTLGLEELIADTAEAYVAAAAALAGDLDRLADMRAGLRQRLQASKLCDRAGFARDIEAAYREMWRRWCVANS